MYINEISIGKFRHLENVKIGPINFNPKTSDLTVIAGPNGGGKSSILELIGFGLSNSYSLGWALSRTFTNFSFEIAIGLNKEEIKVIITSLKETLNPIEKKLDEDKRNIESNESIDKTLRQGQINIIEEQTLRPLKHLYEILEYFKTNNIYYRSYQYPEGEYEKNKNLYNQIHNYVTSELRNKLKRSLGFFLRSDRSYPQKSFDQKRIFSYDSIINREYLWSLSFNTSEIQYQDMYEFLVQQRYHYLRELGNYHNKKNKGVVTNNEPGDPFKPYELLLQQTFPNYRFADQDESVPTNLFIELPSKTIIPFNDLSSGEKEIFFILSFFIRHNVENAIIVIDEPELHLHPELSRLLIRNMKSIRNGNQIWIATHNSEIIDEAGRDKIIYLSKDIITQKAIVTLGDNEENVIKELKKLFGFSGYIGVAKNLVFLEGDNSSADRKFYSNLFPENKTNIKLVPALSSNNFNGINGAILSILESNLGWMNFYLIRDRDYLTDEIANKYKTHKSSKIFVLSKHEIENYLIEFKCISIVLDDIYGIQKTIEEIKDIFYKIAIDMSSSVLRDMISYRLNLFLKPEDFSLGKMFNGQSLFNTSDLTLDDSTYTKLQEKFIENSLKIKTEIVESLSEKSLNKIIEKSKNDIVNALESNEWLNLFPGKELLEKFAKKLGITNSISLQNSIIKELSSDTSNVDNELVEIFRTINNG